jgi:micrococcal nuclease
MRPALAVLLVLAVAACAGGEEAGRSSGQVERITDGDTIRLADGTRVRLVQIDAPEEGDSECYADRATAALGRLVPVGTTVALERDAVLDDRDRFDRALRYVFAGDTNVNLELVRLGAAAPYFFGGDRGRYADDLEDAAADARDEGRGLWGACPRARLDPDRALATER